ncbi:MAG TPA: hypothetical protein VI306_15905 [Pyrinomonadaceae bacterium]
MKPFINALFCAIVLAILPSSISAQNLADTTFKLDVAHPAFTKNAPRVMFDEAHNNFHTSTGRYKPFADLLMNDGYRIVVNRQPFSKKSLDSFKLLVIVNALAEDFDETDADKPAFTEEEETTVRDWVKGGGSLLLIADPGVFAKSAANLAKQLGVEMQGNAVEDPANNAEEFRPSMIVYSRDNHQLLEHSITSGRDTTEKLNKVIVFNGQGIKGPTDAVAFLKLSDTAREVTSGADGTAASVVSAKGLAQALAFKFGGGRVVVMAEADMLSALLGNPPENEPIGMNYPGVDNKQLTLNIMHWLSGLLR